jgi:hypothetical protein
MPRVALFFEGVLYPNGALVAGGSSGEEHFRRVRLSRYVAVEMVAEQAISSGNEVSVSVYRWNFFGQKARNTRLFSGVAREEPGKIVVFSL